MNDFKLEWLETKRCTYQQFEDALAAYMKTRMYKSKVDNEEYSAFDRLDYLSIHERGKENEMLPEYRWIYTWATEGGSEGYYFHIELFTPSKGIGDVVPLFLAKAFCESIQEVLFINSVITEFILTHAYGSYN